MIHLAVQLAKSDIPLKYDLTSLRVISSGAAPLGSEHIIALNARVKAYVRQGYLVKKKKERKANL